jgi:hypothetical protein
MNKRIISIKSSIACLQYRTVITLYHLNDFSYEDIAEITGLPDGTVKNYLFFRSIVFAAIQILDMLLIKKKLPDAET